MRYAAPVSIRSGAGLRPLKVRDVPESSCRSRVGLSGERLLPDNTRFYPQPGVREAGTALLEAASS